MPGKTQEVVGAPVMEPAKIEHTVGSKGMM